MHIEMLKIVIIIAILLHWVMAILLIGLLILVTHGGSPYQS